MSEQPIEEIDKSEPAAEQATVDAVEPDPMGMTTKPEE